MLACPKCNGRMRGPRFGIGARGEHEMPREQLFWTCETCGYVATTAPEDATRKARREL